MSTPFGYKGEKQGCPTSPLLFVILMNKIEMIEIPLTVYKSPGICFADDILIFRSSKVEVIEKFKQFEEWLLFNLMEVNLGKYGVMSIQNNLPEIDLKLNGIKVQEFGNNTQKTWSKNQILHSIYQKKFEEYLLWL